MDFGTAKPIEAFGPAFMSPKNLGQPENYGYVPE